MLCRVLREPEAEHPLKKIAMNVTESKAGSFDAACPMNEMIWRQENQVEKIAFAVTAIILNILSFPVTIVMNVLVIMEVKTRPRLQSKYNILLACLAGIAELPSQFLNVTSPVHGKEVEILKVTTCKSTRQRKCFERESILILRYR